MTGLFITAEGIEGSGKTTQIQLLDRLIRASGHNTVLTKEPGGTGLGERVRAILLDPQEEGMDARTELFLYAASRRQHVVELIRPSLERGAIVLCDRFTDATLAYQGFGRLLDLDRLRSINDWATNGTAPDVTLIFDVPEALGLERAKARNRMLDLQRESRLEGEDLRFHRRVREGYLALAAENPRRYAVIDARGSVEEVFARTVAELNRRLPRLKLALATPA
jgi:dTMP kinase